MDYKESTAFWEKQHKQEEDIRQAVGESERQDRIRNLKRTIKLGEEQGKQDVVDVGSKILNNIEYPAGAEVSQGEVSGKIVNTPSGKFALMLGPAPAQEPTLSDSILKKRTGEEKSTALITFNSRTDEATKMAFPAISAYQAATGNEVTLTAQQQPEPPMVYGAAEAPGLFGSVMKFGETYEQSAAKKRAAGKIGFFDEAIGQTAIFVADTAQSFKETITNPKTALFTAAVLVATRNPKTAQAAGTGLELAMPFIAANELNQIGQGKRVGQTAGEFGAYSLAFEAGRGLPTFRSMAAKAPDVEVSASSVITERVTAKGRTEDFSDIAYTTKYGKEDVTFFGKGRQTFIDTEPGYQVSGGARVNEFVSGKEMEVSFKGAGKKTEQGFDTLLFSKTRYEGKTSLFAEKIKTAEVMSSPAQVFASQGKSLRITREGNVPESVSAGITKEDYIGDMFTGKNIMRKEIFSESGERLGVKQVLESKTLKAGGKGYIDNFPEIQKPDYSLTMKERDMFSSGGTSTVQASGFSQSPILTEQVLTGKVKAFAGNIAKGIRTSQAAESSLKLGGSGLSLMGAKQATMPRSSLSSRFSLSTRAVPKSDVISIPKSTTSLGLSEKNALMPKVTARPLSDSIGLSSKLTTRQGLGTKMATRTALSTRVVTETRGELLPASKGDYGFPVTAPPILPPVTGGIPGLMLNDFSFGRMTRGRKRRTGFTPSFTRELLGLKLPNLPNNRTYTGFELR